MTRKINKLSLSWFLSKNNIAIYYDGGHFSVFLMMVWLYIIYLIVNLLIYQK